MKISVIQPYYSFDGKDTEKCYNGMMELFEACECRDGIIVLPEYSDVPADVKGRSGCRILNPGSISIPKENSAHGYMTLTDNLFEWKDLEQEVGQNVIRSWRAE